jgi:YD repeat-containing protein
MRRLFGKSFRCTLISANVVQGFQAGRGSRSPRPGTIVKQAALGKLCLIAKRSSFWSALCLLVLAAFSTTAGAQTTTYVETTTKGPTTNATCNGTGISDSFLLSSTSGTAATKSIAISSSGFYAAGFTTAANVPNLTAWPASTYTVAIDNTTANANIRITDVCFAQVSSTGTLITSACQLGTINTVLSTAAVRTFSCNMTTAATTASTDRLVAILVLQNTAGSRQTVTLRFNTSTDAVTSTPIPVASVSVITPSTATAGTAVTISGTNFGATRGTGSVTFSGSAATVSTWSDTSITATVPALVNSGNVVVNSNNGTGSSGFSFTIPAPNISNISPDAARPSSSVTIAGTNFGSLQGTLTFNGVAVVPSSWTNSQIVAQVPASATTGAVVVTQGVASNPVTFTVIPPPSISSISPASGPVNTFVTISGAGFGIAPGTSTVKFNGTQATPFSWSDSSIVVPVPVGASTGPVGITADGINSNSLTFTVTGGPSITSLSPASGAPGTVVTISGQNFGASKGTSVVRFNGLPAAVSSWSATSIGVTVPDGATTGAVQVTVSGQTSNGVTFTAVSNGTLSGNISSSADGGPVGGATVQALQNGVVKASATTASDGSYSISTLAAGNYDLRISATGFGTALRNTFAITAGQASAANFSLSAPGTIAGRITQADGVTGISAATVQILVGSAAGSSASTDTSGSYSIGGLNAGAYTVQAGATGYVTKSQSATVTAGNTTTANLSFQPVGANPINYVYDELGRLTAVIDSAGDTAIYRYDALGSILSISRQSSAPLSIISFTPQSGISGASVTINGTGFSATATDDSVQFNGVSANVVSATTTQIVATVPAGATTGPITITTPGGTTTSSTSFTVTTNTGSPTITSFTPSMGIAGAAISISGTNFDVVANDKITFNTSRAATTSATNTQVTGTVPASATSGHIVISTPAGRATSAQDFYVPFGTHLVSDIGFAGRISAGNNQTIALAANQIGLLLFDGSAGQGISLQPSGSTFAGCTLFIYAPGGAQLTSSDCTNSTSVVGSVTEPLTGTYTIGIDPGANAGSINIGLTADVSGTITPGTPLSVSTTAPGQNARYTFKGNSGQQVSVMLSNSTYTGCNAVVINILKPDGTSLGSTGICNSTSGFLDALTLPFSGTYTVLIDPQGTAAGSATVLLNLFNDVSGIITPGTPVTATTTVAGQNAKYTFSGAAGQQVSINISGSTYTGCNAVLVSIMKPDGTTLGSTGLCNTATGLLDSQTLPAAGTYTVLINPQGTVVGSATVVLNTFADVTGSITPGTSLTATTTTAGQNALYTFSGTTGQQVSITLSNSTYTGCNAVVVSILKPDGTSLGSTGICNATSGFLDSLTLPINGTYTVFINPQGTTTGSISVLLNSFADVTGTITPGTPVTVTTTTAGQNALYTFSGTTGQQVSINVSNSTYVGCNAVVVSILKPDNSSLGATGLCNTSSGFLDSLTLPITGTYTVLINPAGTGVGSATVLLNSFADVTGTITPGTPLTVTTTSVGQNAKYTFSGTVGQQVSINVSGSTYTGCNAVLVSILKPDNSSLGSTGLCNTGTGFLDSLTLPTTGTYTVFINPQGTTAGSVTVLLNTFADVTGTITPGTPVTATTTVPGQNALYTFSGTAGQSLSANISNSTYTGCNALVVSVLKPDGTTLGSAGVCNSSSGFMNTVTLPTTGTYTVLINPQGSTTGSATVQLNTDTDVTGTITPGGAAVTVTTTVTGQDARLTFTGTAGQRVSLLVSSVSNPSATVILVKPDGTNQASIGISAGTGTFFMDTQSLATTGTYQIWVQHSGTNVGSEMLQLFDVPADATATTTIGGTAVTVSTTVPGQNATVTFSGTAGQRVSINLSAGTYTSCNLTLKNPDGSSLTTGGCTGATNFINTVPLGTTGTYTILINPNANATGSVTARVNDDTDVTGTIAPGGPAVTIATTIAGQDARLTFSGTAGQRVSLLVSSVSNPSATVILVKPDGSNQASIGISSGTGTFFMDTQSLATTGTYQIRVQHSGTNVGSETLQLFDVPADVTGAITPGTPVTATTTTPGQNALYTFSGVAGQQVSVNISSSTYTGCNAVVVSILKPDGTTLGSAGLCNTSTGFIDSLTLPTAGAYTLLINPQGTATGNATVLLNSFADVTGTIAPGTPVTVTTTSPGQNALFTFSGTTGQQMSINLSGSTYTGCNAVVISMLKPDGTTLGSTGICNNSSGLLDSLTLPSTGTYTVFINPQGTTTGSITALLNNFSDVTGAITPGTPVTANTTTPGQNALLTFTGAAGQQVSINLSGSTYTGCNAVVVSILKPDNSSLGSTGLCNTATGFLDSLTLPSAGTYTVFINPQGTTTGSVTVLLNTFADVTGPISPGTAVTATTTTPGQNALYTFSGTTGQQVSINISNSTYTGCSGVVVSVLKPDNTSLGSVGLCNTATQFLDALTLPTTGSYTVLVNPQGTTTGSVTLVLNSFADVTGAITPGTPVAVTTGSPGQNALYTFSGTAAQQATLSLTGSTYTGCSAVVQSILKPDGTSLGSSGICNSTTGSLGPLTLPTTGTYTVFINPQGTTTGSVNVNLTLQ